MTYVITGACIESMDRSCIEVCPVDCIYEAGQMLVIHPGECIDCGACVPECPVEAIHAREDVPASAEAFVAVNAAIERGVGDVDTAVQAVLAQSPSP
jgi:ferredoxin